MKAQKVLPGASQIHQGTCSIPMDGARMSLQCDVRNCCELFKFDRSSMLSSGSNMQALQRWRAKVGFRQRTIQRNVCLLTCAIVLAVWIREKI